MKPKSCPWVGSLIILPIAGGDARGKGHVHKCLTGIGDTRRESASAEAMFCLNTGFNRGNFHSK